MNFKLILALALSFWSPFINNHVGRSPTFRHQPVPEDDKIAMIPADTVIVSNVFGARLRLIPKESSSRKTPFYSSFMAQIVFDDYKVAGRIYLPKGTRIFRPGEARTVSVKLNAKAELSVGKRFEISVLGDKIGEGVVLEVLKRRKEDN